MNLSWRGWLAALALLSVGLLALNLFLGRRNIAALLRLPLLAETSSLLPALEFRRPCGRPLTYRLGRVDARFALTEKDFQDAIVAAEQLWEKPLRRDLFVYDAHGALSINAIYDQRQAAADRLRTLGLNVDNTRASYDALTAKYDRLRAEYAQTQKDIATQREKLDSQRAAYEAAVATWHGRGGDLPNELTRLQDQQASINAAIDALNGEIAVLNQQAANLNALITVLNRLGSELNVDVSRYNQISTAQGQEFEEGLYTSDTTGTRIDVFEFDNRPQLVRLLAHELGHALGLEHVADPEAIMYRLNQATNSLLTADDIAAVESLCGRR